MQSCGVQHSQPGLSVGLTRGQSAQYRLSLEMSALLATADMPCASAICRKACWPGLISLIQCNSEVLLGELRTGLRYLHNCLVMRAADNCGHLSILLSSVHSFIRQASAAEAHILKWALLIFLLKNSRSNRPRRSRKVPAFEIADGLGVSQAHAHRVLAMQQHLFVKGVDVKVQALAVAGCLQTLRR
jgi:hypothetical protein